MKSHGNVPFDDFRRERVQRRAQSGTPLRPIAKGQEVLREIEEAESRELQEQRLTREVHDFFADATRTAAGIVKRVTEAEVENTTTRLRDEVEEFLRDTINRAQAFVTMLQLMGATPEAERLVEAKMQNLVGPLLDGFRNEGTAQLGDKHLGQNPFSTALAPAAAKKRGPAGPASGTGPAARPAAEAAPPDDHRGIEHHLVAELSRGAGAEAGAAPAARSGNEATELLLTRIGNDAQKLKSTLKAMVKNGVLTREEAQQVWAEFKIRNPGS
jgi:hypothetical protein